MKQHLTAGPPALLTSVSGGGFVWVSVALLVGLAALLATPLAAQELTDVNEIIDQANQAAYYAGEDGRSDVRLTITSDGGSEQTRILTIIRRDEGDTADQSFLVVITRPADLRDTVFLVEKHVGSDDDRWLYLPDLDLVRRIAAGDKRTSFIGSHFFYEDISGRGTEEDTHTLFETTDTQYVIDSVPLDAGDVEFVSYRIWIDRETMLPMLLEYTDDTGEVYRRLEVLSVETVDGYPTVARSRMSDLRGGGSHGRRVRERTVRPRYP